LYFSFFIPLSCSELVVVVVVVVAVVSPAATGGVVVATGTGTALFSTEVALLAPVQIGAQAV
jgi:hypothetical protein